MSNDKEHIRKNLEVIQQRMAEAAVRSEHAASEVELIPVTKMVGMPEIRALYDLGLRHFGENRVEVAAEKIPQLDTEEVVWHMIAPLQRRKVRDAVALFQRIDAVDRVKVAESIQRRCEDADTTMPVLLELNISGEVAKQGLDPASLKSVMGEIAPLDRLQVQGLMTMAPYDAEEAQLRSIFRALRQYADELGLPVRSMGMTNDFEIAIEEGATEVRIGRALFA